MAALELSPIECVDEPSAHEVEAFLRRLSAALEGGAPVLVLPRQGPERSRLLGAAERASVPKETALVVPTSGSTGTPRLARLSRAALTASASLTHEALGGPGRWLLALPTTHIAGLQVLVRSLVAGQSPASVDLSGGFTPTAFTEAVAALDVSDAELPHYTSLVPTQLQRLLDDGAAVEALWHFDAVLVGGAAVPAALVERARESGVSVVTTYGMTETCGGCVYDGVPLPGVRVDADGGGVIRIAGPTLFDGYVGDDDLGGGWFTTSDLGRVERGIVTIDGRVDTVIVSGGVKVPAEAVERALLALPEVRDVVVVGVRDAQWGERVVAVAAVVSPGGEMSVDDLRRGARGAVPDTWLPRELVTVDAIPTLASGKPDRPAVQALLRDLAR